MEKKTAIGQRHRLCNSANPRKKLEKFSSVEACQTMIRIFRAQQSTPLQGDNRPTCGMNARLSSCCCFIDSRRWRFRSTSCLCRAFSSSVRTNSSFIPTAKHRRNRHDEHRRICRQRIFWSVMPMLVPSSKGSWWCWQVESRIWRDMNFVQ